MVAAIHTSPAFEVLSRSPLFDAANFVSAEDHANYDVSPDGRRFVMIRSPQPSQIQLVQNWTALLRER
jgi:hypothetical protein